MKPSKPADCIEHLQLAHNISDADIKVAEALIEVYAQATAVIAVIKAMEGEKWQMEN